MKKLILTILSSSLIISSSFGNQTLELTKAVSKKLKEFRLRDGRQIKFKKEVKKLHLYNGKIDFLELFSGEIVDRTDIQALRLLDNHTMILRAAGVDGGG